jgi:hypothetical protein
MADYLERLARRTLGQLEVVRPDLAPVFGARAIDARERQSDAPSVASRARPSPLSSGASSEVSTRAVLNSDAPRGPFAGTSSIDRTPLSIEPSSIVEATLGRTEQVHSSSVTIAVSAPEPSPMRSTPRQAGERVAHGPSTTMAALDVPDARSSERPMVSITIGRIDVRAMPAPASAPPVSKPRSSQLRTLEHYLAERNGGRS